MKVDARFWQWRSKCCRTILSATFLVTAFCVAAPFAGAQSTGGRIRGTVIDASGGAVPAASVTLIHEANHATREVQFGASGDEENRKSGRGLDLRSWGGPLASPS